MSNVGQRERATHNNVVRFLSEELKYSQIGDRKDSNNNYLVKLGVLSPWLKAQESATLQTENSIQQLQDVAAIGKCVDFPIFTAESNIA